MRAPGDGGVTAEQTRVGPAQRPGHHGQGIGEAPRELVLGETHDLEVGVERSRRQPEADPSRKARRQPRHLLGDQRGGRNVTRSGHGAAHPLGMASSSHPAACKGLGMYPANPPWCSLVITPSNPASTPSTACSRSSRTISGAESSMCGYSRSEIDPSLRGRLVLHGPILSQGREATAVDHHGLARDVAGPVTEQEHDDGGDVGVGITHPAEGTTRARRSSRLGVLDVGPVERRACCASGDTHTTPTPSGPHSTARLLARPRTAPLTAA